MSNIKSPVNNNNEKKTPIHIEQLHIVFQVQRF